MTRSVGVGWGGMNNYYYGNGNKIPTLTTVNQKYRNREEYDGGGFAIDLLLS